MRTAPALRRFNSSCNRSISSTGPETTHRSGELWAARVRRPFRSGTTCASDSATASIAPGGMRCISSPRATASFSASSSDSTPATHAAAYSPKL
ncbi:hypothetical protein COSO111634_27440 [Corallococcus soli]